MMYLGLTMTYASVFQMLRGSVVVFTGILSIMMLNRKLWPCHWLGMLLVMGGAFVVGVRYTFSSISWLVLLLLKPLVIFLTGPQMHARD
jgi:drug/metabolite transporter (DMT)-like permease